MKKVLFGLVLLSSILVACSGNTKNEESSKDNSSVKTSESSNKPADNKKDDKTFYKVGDSVKVGDVTYTLNSVELTDERNELEDTQPANVVKITYTVKNDGKEDLPVGTDIEVYGSDDKKAETYANENTMDSVAPGKQMDVTAHFGLNQTGDIEIQFSPLLSFEKAAKFKATV